MAEGEEEYTIERDEMVFIRTVAAEITIMQTLRELSRLKHSDEAGQQKYLQELKEEADSFNKFLNAEDTPQNKAWITALEKQINWIYSGAMLPDLYDEDEVEE